MKYISPAQESARKSGTSATGKKELVIKTGLQLIAEKGLNNTSINEIIKEAGISKGSFYYYFTDKEDFLRSALMGIWPEHVFDELDKMEDASISEQLVAYVRIYTHAIADNMGWNFCRIWAKVMMDMTEPSMRLAADTSYLLKIIERGIENGELREDVDALKLSKMILTYLYGCCFVWDINKEEMHVMGTYSIFCDALRAYISQYASVNSAENRK